MQDPLILISLTIGQATYKLKVPTNKESQIRTSIASLNTIIEKYKLDFPGQKEHDYLAMAIISFITEQGQGGIDNAETLKALQAIDMQL